MASGLRPTQASLASPVAGYGPLASLRSGADPGPPVAPGTPDPALGSVRGRASGIPRLIPGHAYDADVAARIDANRAALSVARKITRRAHHILRGLGDQAFTPVPAGR
jgi:hypothetical protein